MSKPSIDVHFKLYLDVPEDKMIVDRMARDMISGRGKKRFLCWAAMNYYGLLSPPKEKPVSEVIEQSPGQLDIEDYCAIDVNLEGLPPANDSQRSAVNEWGNIPKDILDSFFE